MDSLINNVYVAIYALSLVMLGISCMYLDIKRAKDTLHWMWLGMWSFLSSLVVLLTLFDYIVPYSETINILLLLGALSSLLEMVRSGEKTISGTKIRPSALHIMLITIFLVSVALSVWRQVAFFLFHFLSGWLIWILYRKAVQSKIRNRKTTFRIMTITISFIMISSFLYHFFSGSRFLIQYDNYLAIYYAIAIWITTYSLIVLSGSYTLGIYQKSSFFESSIIIISGVIITGIVVFVGYQYLTNQEQMLIDTNETELENQIKQLKFQIDSLNSFSWGIASSIADNFYIQQFMMNKTNVSYAQSNRLIDFTKDELNFSVIYVMDKDGVTVLSTNRDTPSSFLGKNYSFRPYFQEAIIGRNTYYLARGITSKIRGAYYSIPVDSAQNHIGVVVIKNNIEDMVKNFKFFENAHLVSPENLIFVSSKPEWLYTFISNASADEINWASNSKQYGLEKVRYLGSYTNNGYYQTNDGTTYMYKAIDVNPPGWKVFIMRDTSELLNSRRKALSIFMVSALSIFFIGIFALHYHVHGTKVKISEASFQDVFENSNDMIIRFRPDGLIMYTNPSAQKAIELTNKKLTTMKIFSFLNRASQSRLRRIMKDREKNTINLTLAIKNRRILTEGSIHSRIIQGTPVLYTALLQDITEKTLSIKKEAKRTKELEWINKITVGRELKMVELKKKIRELEQAK